MLFLFAELFYYSFDFRLNYCTDEELDTDAKHWYLEAAKAGSPHAMLRCSWCMEEGINGFAKEPMFSAAILNSLPEIPKTLGLSELSFLKEELLSMVEQAYDADREEDELGDMYHYEKEKYEEYLPNPGWRTLHMRCIELGWGFPMFWKNRGMIMNGIPHPFRKSLTGSNRRKPDCLIGAGEKGWRWN